MEEPKIVKVKELLQYENLVIPEYQRPYKWGIRHVSELMNDILHHRKKNAYRLGTLVLHTDKGENGNTRLNIVDGQQRTITLTLIALAIINQKGELLKSYNNGKDYLEKYRPELATANFTNKITIKNIRNNYLEIERRIREFDEQTIDFFYNKCELVEVRLNDVSEAFQFFDSQNARGKDLEPHDLLKAFHLREMEGLPEEVKQEAIVEWEAMPTKELAALFSEYLFRIRNWSRSQSARYFTKSEVDIFKGVSFKSNETLPFAQAQRIAHFYVENYNFDYHRNVDSQQMKYPFQIADTIINGKRFFEMIAHYKNKLKDIKAYSTKLKYEETETENASLSSAKKIFRDINQYDGKDRTGDQYVRMIFDCSVLHYIDKFGLKEIERAVEKLFIISYSLRLRQTAVQLASADKHVLEKINVFKIIRDATFPSDILNMQLESEEVNNSTKTEMIKELFKELNYYHGK